MKTIPFALTLLLAVPNAFATLTPTYERGDTLVFHDVAGKSPEVCVVPTHLPGGDYSKKDRENENELCAMNIGENVAACPKDYSTNPGTDFYIPPAGVSVAELQKKNCDLAGAKKEAKYKLSTSCSYAPAILAYYHVSRMLGGAGNVPVAVVRTMDLDRHKAVAEKALKILKPGDLIYKTWSGLYSALKSGNRYTRTDIFTDDYAQSWGALTKNPKKELFYKEFFNGGADRTVTFRERNAIYKALQKSSLPVSREWNAKNVQAMVAMKDMSDMIVLDTILGQQDRFGNIHYQNKFYYRSEVSGHIKSDKDKEDVPPSQQAHAVVVKELLLKDNDCGVAKENRVKAAGLLDRIVHMDPRTYGRVLQLARTIEEPETKKLFRRGMLLTEDDFKKVSANVSAVARDLHTACKSGRLKLDLNLDIHFSDMPLDGSYSCDI